jgi:tight adherence protein B
VIRALPAFLSAASVVAATAGLRRLRLEPAAVLAAGRRAGILGRTRRGRALAAALRRAGVGLGADGFVAGVLISSLAVGAVAWMVIGTPAIAMLAALGVVAAAWTFVASADRRYIARFANQLPIVAQQLAGAIGAGQSLRQAISRAAGDAPEPSATELRRLATDLEFGARIDDALEAAAARLPDPGMRVMVTAILVQRVVGGNLSQALADLSARLEERAVLEREARSATAQARMSAWLVAGLPFGCGMLVEIASPGTLARSFGHGLGLAILTVATLLNVCGVLAIRRIVGREGMSV